MITETVLLSALRLYQQEEMDTTDPEQWEALADLYERYGLVSNADTCRRRAQYYRKVCEQSGGVHEQNR